MALTKVIGAGLGAVTQDGAASFNEGSADVDFRVESNGQTHMLFVDGGNNSVGLGSSNPDSGRKLHIEGGDTTVGITLKDTAGQQFGIFSDGGSFVIKSDSTASEYVRVDSTGAVTKPLQPAFSVKPAATQSNLSTSGPTIAFGTEIFDVNADFASNTFTAPVTGKYYLSAQIGLLSVDSACAFIGLDINTSNRHYYSLIDPDFGQDPAYWELQWNGIVDMDANDTVNITYLQSGGAAQADVEASHSNFTGVLVC